jgi:hypothetical protein
MPGFCLDEEQRARVRDCLHKAHIVLPGAVFDRFVRDTEDTISRFRGIEPSAGFREAHDALRAIWALAHEDDPPVGVLRARIKALPKPAIEYIDRRSPRVIPRLFPGDPFENGAFLAWADNASGVKLVQALRILSADGAQVVAGRSRGRGKRSALRLEPVIFGEARGAGAKKRKGGRPSEEARHQLVMHLALDWVHATGQMPEPGRSGETGFGDFVHSVFQWLLNEEDGVGEAATYALRTYWDTVRNLKRRPPLSDFLARHGEEP